MAVGRVWMACVCLESDLTIAEAVSAVVSLVSGGGQAPLLTVLSRAHLSTGKKLWAGGRRHRQLQLGCRRLARVRRVRRRQNSDGAVSGGGSIGGGGVSAGAARSAAALAEVGETHWGPVAHLYSPVELCVGVRIPQDFASEGGRRHHALRLDSGVLELEHLAGRALPSAAARRERVALGGAAARAAAGACEPVPWVGVARVPG